MRRRLFMRQITDSITKNVRTDSERTFCFLSIQIAQLKLIFLAVGFNRQRLGMATYVADNVASPVFDVKSPGKPLSALDTQAVSLEIVDIFAVKLLLGNAGQNAVKLQ